MPRTACAYRLDSESGTGRDVAQSVLLGGLPGVGDSERVAE